MSILAVNIICFAFMVASVVSVVLIKRYLRRRLEDMDGFCGIVRGDEQNVIAVLGDDTK